MKRVSDTTSQAIISTAAPSPALEPSVLTAAKGGGIIFAGTVFKNAVRLAIGIILPRSLGSEEYGLYSLALTAATVAAGLALLGLKDALVRYISIFASQRDEEGVWGTLQIGIGLTTALSALIAVGLYLGASPIAERVFHEPRLASLLRLISLMVPFWTLIDVLAAATQGFKKMQYTAVVQDISQPTIKLILVCVLVITGLTAADALAAHILSVVIASMMLLYFLNRLFALKRSIRTARRDGGEILKFASPLYLSELIQTFRRNIQTLFLGALHTITTVGVFTVASQVNILGKMFHGSICTASMPIVSELYGGGEQEQLGRFYQVASRWTLTLNLPLFLIVLLFPGPILSIFGEDFAGGALALTILAWSNLIDASTGISGIILDMSGKTYWRLAHAFAMTAATLGLSVLLIPRWGMVGAATAVLGTTVVVNVLRVLPVLIWMGLVPYNRSSVKPVAAGLVTLVAAWVGRDLFHTDANLVYATLNVALVFLVYGGMILLLGLSPEDRIVLGLAGQRVSAVFGR